MARVFKLNSVIKSVSEDGDQLKIVGYASTADTDRVGDVIVPDAWTKGGLDNYLKNPILLFNHNYSQPIGRATNIEVDARGLKIEASISKSAGPTYGLVKDGVLSTFSVGFTTRDVDYNQQTDGYIIRDAELLEVSVVSVPCNQEAGFSVSKSFNNAEDLNNFKKEALKGQEENEQVVKTTDVETAPKSGTENVPPENIVMNPEELQAMIAEATAKALAASKAADEKAAKEEADRKAAAEATSQAVTVAAQAVVKTMEEKLLADFETRVKTNEEDFQKTFAEMKGDFEAKSQELQAMAASKRMFSDRDNVSSDPIEKNYAEAETAVLLSKALRVGVNDTNFGKKLMEKFNTHSTVTVGTDRLETTVSTSIEKDIEAQLILKPLFREILMTSAQMSFPIAPDSGYAEITSATTASGAQPNGNVDQRGAGYGAPYQGITLTEKLFSTIKMIGRGYLGNETEEDAIIPILPIVKDAMVRSHARGIENMILAGNTNQGVYTSGAANGLLKFASTAGRTIETDANYSKLTAANLFSLRKLMGLRGRDPRNVVYIISQDAWYQLAEDPEFLNADQVTASNAVKLTGTVGRIYNSDVLVCDEFAPAGPGNYFAMALNASNFVVPRLRGMTVESEYSVDRQHTLLVASQRLGFDEVIPNAPSVVGLKFKAA